jgi:cytochrome b561
MRIQNSKNHYGIVAKSLHWVIAFAIFTMLGLGFVAKNITDRALIGQLFWVHKSLGLTLLAAMLLRLIWRLINTTPRYPAQTPSWQITVAKTVHWCFYISIISTIIIGWLVSSTGKHGITLWGWFDAALPTGRNRALHHLTEAWHYWLAWLIVGLITLHIAAALKHWLVNRDRIMQRMLFD